MVIARVIEVSASAPKDIEDAVPRGLAKVSRTARNIEGAWLNEAAVTTGDGAVSE
ncbi:MAG: dodecin domain-containing protein [Mizugakiibacter sp.]|uniref:dodecin domain-containing protein n=1 Tax=Mizugakiibacter sp. TaxID=1972610 RepID=UPI0031CA69A9|nr:dodecin family protein [Xanthomonadaceae bacterium]